MGSVRSISSNSKDMLGEEYTKMITVSDLVNEPGQLYVVLFDAFLNSHYADFYVSSSFQRLAPCPLAGTIIDRSLELPRDSIVLEVDGVRLFELL